jgi:hypothetical protein
MPISAPSGSPKSYRAQINSVTVHSIPRNKCTVTAFPMSPHFPLPRKGDRETATREAQCHHQNLQDVARLADQDARLSKIDLRLFARRRLVAHVGGGRCGTRAEWYNAAAHDDHRAGEAALTQLAIEDRRVIADLRGAAGEPVRLRI